MSTWAMGPAFIEPRLLRCPMQTWTAGSHHNYVEITYMHGYTQECSAKMIWRACYLFTPKLSTTCLFAIFQRFGCFMHFPAYARNGFCFCLLDSELPRVGIMSMSYLCELYPGSSSARIDFNSSSMCDPNGLYFYFIYTISFTENSLDMNIQNKKEDINTKK